MYQFIYDTFTADRKYRKEIADIENRLTDLGLLARVERMTLFKNAREVIAEGIRRGVKTIVAVGNDATVRTLLAALPTLNVTLGLIPLGDKDQFLADLFGIPRGIDAVGVISARLVEKLDVGSVNDQLFLTSITIPGGKLTLSCEDQFAVTTGGGAVSVYNLPTGAAGAQKWSSNPTDGYFETVIESSSFSLFGNGERRVSVVPVKKMMISSREAFSIMVDGQKFRGNRAAVEVLPQKLKMIVGKGRRF